MRFRLTYEGPLYASRSADKPARARHKQDIRKAFHPQLKRLWELTPHLAVVPSVTGFLAPLPDMKWGDVYPADYSRKKYLAGRFTCEDFKLVPLVTEDLSLLCALDILLLRPGNPGAVLSSGDVDNRIKTVIDGLKRPTDTNELGGHKPEAGENPFYVLLENDSLINHLSVETDRLLQPIGDGYDENDARVIITVTVKPAEVKLGNLSFA